MPDGKYSATKPHPALTFPNAEPEVCPFPLLCIWLVGCFEIGIHCVVQAGLELTMKAGPPSYSRAIPRLSFSVDYRHVCATPACVLAFLYLFLPLKQVPSLFHTLLQLSKMLKDRSGYRIPFLMVTLTCSSQDGVAMLLIQQGF